MGLLIWQRYLPPLRRCADARETPAKESEEFKFQISDVLSVESEQAAVWGLGVAFHARFD